MYPLGFNTKPILDYRHTADQAAQELSTHTYTHIKIHHTLLSTADKYKRRIWGVYLRGGSGSWNRHKGLQFGELHLLYLASFFS